MKYRIIERTYSTGERCFRVQRKRFLFWEDDIDYRDFDSPTFFLTIEDARKHIAAKRYSSTDKVIEVC